VADVSKFVVAKKAGAQTVASLAATENFYNDTDTALTIRAVRATLGTAPTGSTFIVDVLVGGTSIYTGVTANRPTIAISGNTALGGTPATTTIAAGAVVTFAVTQIGSTVAGSDLAIQLTLDTSA
jgi:hypothetical protein